MNKSEQHILQKNLAQFLVSEVFNTITEDDILKITSPNVWTHKGKPLTPGQIVALRNEAKAFRESGLWKILGSELVWLGQQNSSMKSQTEEDLVAAKLLLYLVQVINNKLEKMSVV